MSITADKESAVVEQAPTQLFIGGEWRDASGGGTLGVEDPRPARRWSEVADATPDDAKPRSTPPWRCRTSGRGTRRASAARSCAACSRR